MPYNAIAGASESAVNSVLQQLYEALAPSGLFKFEQNIGKAGFDKVAITITEAPKAILKSTVPSQIKDDVVNSVKENFDLDKAGLQAALDTVAKTTIKVQFPSINIHLDYANPSPGSKPLEVNCCLDVIAGLQLDTSLSPVAGTVKAISAQATIQDDNLQNILNNAIIPAFLPDLNELFGTMSIPTIAVESATLSVPVPVVDDGYLLAYAALGPFTPLCPKTGLKVSQDSVFVCADADFISTVVSPFICRQTIPRTDFSFGILQVYYLLSFSGLESVTIGPTGDLTAKARFSGSVGFNVNHGQMFLPRLAYSVEAYGTVGITAHAGIRNQNAYIKIDSLDQFTFDLNLTAGKPWARLPFLEGKIDDAIAALRDTLVNKYLKPVVMEKLGGKEIVVSPVPAIPVRIGSGFELIIHSVETTRVNFEGKDYLMAYGMPQIGALS